MSEPAPSEGRDREDAPPRSAPPPLPPDSASGRETQSLAMLAICLGVLTAASVIEVSPERVHVHGIEGPPCLVRGVFGDAACPGCGLTRSTAFVLQGAWGSAWAIHPGGFVIALLCGVGIPLNFVEWRRSRQQRRSGVFRGAILQFRWALLARWAILVGVIGPWLWRLVLAR